MPKYRSDTLCIQAPNVLGIRRITGNACEVLADRNPERELNGNGWLPLNSVVYRAAYRPKRPGGEPAIAVWGRTPGPGSSALSSNGNVLSAKLPHTAHPWPIRRN